MNDGKVFEKDWKDSAMKQGLFILRLNDSSLSWQHEKTSKYTLENPCDFIQYFNGALYALELKSTKYASMSIQTDLSGGGMIKMHQINSLSNFSLFEGICAGLVLNFRDDEIEEKNITYFLPIQNFNNFIEETGKKSINQTNVIDYGGIVIEQKKKRTHYSYDIMNFFKSKEEEELKCQEKRLKK